MMVDFKEIDSGGETWELFARDFFIEMGYNIEISPDRGPDGKKDLIISEYLNGHLLKIKFRWLVSCKHYANSGKSVKEEDEINIHERLDSFECDGFIGFYSTIPSSGLNNRLDKLYSSSKIKGYKVFDNRFIESHLLKKGFSQLLLRYFPISYRLIKPLNLVMEKFIPLNCTICGVELLEKSYKHIYSSIVVYDYEFIAIDEGKLNEKINNIYCVCKDECDSRLKARIRKHTDFDEIDDLSIPLIFIEWLLGKLESINNGEVVYSPNALKQFKYIVVAISQKALRETSEIERTRYLDVIDHLTR